MWNFSDHKDKLYSVGWQGVTIGGRAFKQVNIGLLITIADHVPVINAMDIIPINVLWENNRPLGNYIMRDDETRNLVVESFNVVRDGK